MLLIEGHQERTPDWGIGYSCLHKSAPSISVLHALDARQSGGHCCMTSGWPQQFWCRHVLGVLSAFSNRCDISRYTPVE